MSTVLVIEPDKNQRLLLQEELESDGHTILPVATAGDALLSVDVGHVDLVVMEVGRPHTANLRLVPLLSGLRRHIPVIVHTGYPLRECGPIARLADAYVLKHSDLGELKDVIASLLCGGLPATPRPASWWSSDARSPLPEPPSPASASGCSGGKPSM
jgi:CheY-like chemotaxis protein